MMTGRIATGREPILRITVCGANDTSVDFDALVDTGFTGMLTLLRRAIQDLGLRYVGLATGKLADDSRFTTRRYKGAVMWHGQVREVRVLESEGGPLLGMSLLYGSRVLFEAQDGGMVTIESMR